ncbi:histidine kinase [Mucilaginibacter sp. BJC16-A38]|uniref:sensor histidine kinase n=1 Tax=Mucilaginibacter phenanthrenivorans TaxID=1234842 RepID=UPI0021572C79|nr:histidine kinase [Mucilaginibacter phenanthrenivorans]MCR8561195.1 histidine kinase [Mucilaginibacter phenanthrenivorans]
MNFTARIIAFHRQNKVLSHIWFWISALLVATMEESYQFSDGWFSANRLLFHAVTLITQIMTAYFLAYFVIPGFLNSRKPVQMSIYTIAGMYLICALARLLNLHVYEPLSGIPPKAFENLHEVFTNLGRLFYVYFFRNLSIAIVFLFLKLLTDQYETQQKALRLEKEKSKAELKLLKAQLNPHFLFNTLNNIYSLSFTSSPVTSEAIARLADILDHILYRCDTQFVPLSAEVALIRNYIELEKLRYDKRLTVNFNERVDHQIVIAPLILLSLVENAFKHGASDDTGAPVIDIDLQVNEQNFIFNISNTVAGQKNGIENLSAYRIGLNNLRKQLDLIYGKGYALDVNRQTQSFEVNLTIDLKHQTAVDEKN